MKISYNRLQQFIHLDESPEEIASILTSIGLEVEGLSRFESIKGGLAGLVVGEVKEVTKHPNADKLNCTKVDIGSGELLPIVCGAPNVAQGQKVIVATVGTMLYPTEGDGFEIKKAKIRGEVSQGMICAEDEIGVGESHDGIMVLDPSTEIGTRASELFDVTVDHVFEIGLTPNRADAASHYGVARDLKAALSRKKGKKIALCKPSVEDFKKGSVFLNVPVEVHNTEACPRYVGVSIANVTVQASPTWLRDFLLAIGVRPINNVVDVTNYINHAFGQPLHAFDADKIKGGRIHVRTMPQNTSFTTLDGEERKLDANDLMICDEAEGLCIAGVFGGEGSGVTTSTRNVFLESAYFNPVWVRKTAKRHGLNTDASFRFERGVDPNNTVYAAKLAAMMIAELGGGEIGSEVSDTHPEVFPPFEVDYRTSKANALIGVNIPTSETKTILNDLEMEVVNEEDASWKLNVPPFKVDVTREADVIEEVLRIYGYDEVPVSSKVLSTIKDIRPDDTTLAKEACTKQLVANGYLECMSNSMTDESYAGLSKAWKESDVVHLNNPLSSELGIMRPALIFSALQNAAYNANRQQSNLRLFEFGNIYLNGSDGFFEEQRLGIIVGGSALADHWRTADLNADWYEVRAAFESILQRLGIDELKLSMDETESDWFTYGVEWKKGKEWVARGGKIDPAMAKRFDLKKEVFYIEVRWNALVSLRQREIAIGQLPKYPEVRRDLALLVDEQVRYRSLEQLAYQTEKQLLRSVKLFDVYQGKGMPEGKKSYALAFMLRSDAKTLTDQEVDKIMGKLQKRFEAEVGAQLR